MRHSLRLLVLLVMVGFLIFASTPQSEAGSCNWICARACNEQFNACQDDYATCCGEYNYCIQHCGTSCIQCQPGGLAQQ